MTESNQAKSAHEGPKKKEPHGLYASFGPAAEIIKISLQMLIAAAIIVLLAWKLFYRYRWIFHSEPIPDFFAHNPALWIVGKGLAYSAGVDLAYMLFTPGPDEAIEPLILGIASATLLVVSGDLEWRNALIVAVLTITLGIAFLIRYRFINETGKQQPGPSLRHE